MLKKSSIEKLSEKFLTNPPNPAFASFEEWNKIEEQHRKNHPIAYFIFYTLEHRWSNFKRSLNNILWWFKYRFVKKHQYHEVHTNLTVGYHDLDERLLYAAFSLLADYIEQSCGGIEDLKTYLEEISDTETGERVDAVRSAIELYDWWTEKRPTFKINTLKCPVDYSLPLTAEDSSKLIEYDQKLRELEKDDTEQLVKLCHIRQYLW